jgi:ketosteroid isomerase-like protein
VARENVEIVRRSFDAYSRGDLDAMVADFAPDCDYVATGVIAGTGGVYKGPEGYKRFLDSFNEEFDDPRAEVHQLVEAGDHVLVSATLRGRGKQSGAETSWPVWQVWELRNGKFVHGQGFTDREQALEAAGLEE